MKNPGICRKHDMELTRRLSDDTFFCVECERENLTNAKNPWEPQVGDYVEFRIHGEASVLGTVERMPQDDWTDELWVISKARESGATDYYHIKEYYLLRVMKKNESIQN